MPQNTSSSERTEPKKLQQHQPSQPQQESDAVFCDRCSGPMFRMRAVYWCVNCGYKTDCCGS
jgi:hypothetical protein